VKHLSRTDLALALALALFTGSVAPALAEDRDATAAERQLVRDHLSTLGYSRISDVDVVGTTFEVDARSPQGGDVDVILDRETLAVIGVERS
jgi:hypothetical protein